MEEMRKMKQVSQEDVRASREDVRTRSIEVALQLLKEGGRDALTTRAVADAAGIQAPTLYRLFGDKRGLLDAMVEYSYVSIFKTKKAQKYGPDPLENLRKAWEHNTKYGLENPILYALIVGDPRPGFPSPVTQKVQQRLGETIHQIALAGRLRVIEKQAVELVYAASTGAVLALLAMPEEQRDLRLAQDACEAVIAAITNDSPTSNKPGAEAAAITLKAALPEVKSLTDGERLFLTELLDRIATRG
jgi:AcrR family transcriptional regulator